jgi:hypothetical protein
LDVSEYLSRRGGIDIRLFCSWMKHSKLKPRGLKISRRSRVQRFRGSRFHSRPWTAFGMRNYEKSVSFVRPNPKFGAKLAMIWEKEHF